MVYLDMTFCQAYKECKDGKNCGRAYTPQVRKEADEWWGKPGAPISLMSKFNCFRLKCKFVKREGESCNLNNNF